MLVTLDQFKDSFGITDSDSDDMLTEQLQLVSDVVESYCKRKFAQATYIQTFYRDEVDCDVYPKYLPLYHFPLISVTSVVKKTSAVDTGTAFTEFRNNLKAARLIANTGNNFYDSQIIEVTYSAGFTSVPTIITNTIKSIVQERYNKKKAGIDLNFGSDVQRISIPGAISIDYDYSLQSNDRKTAFGNVLGNYVNMLDSFRSERAIVGDIRLAYV